MKRRLVAVEYDCQKLVLLPDCELSGEYQYAGITPREQVIRMGDEFEVRANLPLGGLSLAGQLGGDFQRGNTLDVALAIVGQRAAVKRRVLRSELAGECRGATHFIRSAMVGAFAMEKGTRGHVKTAAQVFGLGVAAQSHEASHVVNRDGSLEACRKGDGRDDEVPGCAAPLRVELRPLLERLPGPEAATAAVEETLAPSCPAGTRGDDSGKCVSAENGGPYVCAVSDPADCEKQCERGSMASCTILARSYQIGRGIDQDMEKAATLYVKACKARVAPACGRIGELMLKLKGKEREGLDLLQKACADGWSDGCVIAGSYLAKTAPGSKDVVAPTLRACKLGSAEGCWSMGQLLTNGLLQKDEARAAEFFKLACEGRCAAWLLVVRPSAPQRRRSRPGCTGGRPNPHLELRRGLRERVQRT
jgi:hypothetical protein